MGPMHRFGILILAGDRPKRRLLAITGPVALRPDRVPAGLVLPMIIAAADDEPLLSPDDLGADSEPLTFQARRHRGRVQRPMPHVRDAAGKKGPRGLPVGVAIILNLPGTA